MKFSNAHHSLRVKILQSTEAMKRREYEWKVTTKTTSWLKDKFELPWNALIKNFHKKMRFRLHLHSLYLEEVHSRILSKQVHLG